MDILQFIRDYWPILSTAVACIIFWSSLKTKDEEQEKRITKLENYRENDSNVLLTIQKDIVELKTILKMYFEQNKK